MTWGDFYLHSVAIERQWLVASDEWRECSLCFRRAIYPPLPYGRLELAGGECFQSFASISNRVFVIRICVPKPRE